MLASNLRTAKILLVLTPFMLGACARTADLDEVRAQAQAALAAADKGQSDAASAQAAAQQALIAAQQAQADAKTASDEANRMYQRSLRKQ